MVLIESFSGIRGIYPEDLSKEIASKYSYIFQEFLKEKLNRIPLIVVGTDSRPSFQDLKEAMILPLKKAIDVGIMTTPGVQFAVRHFKADAGIIITASHNPPEYNGFKFLINTGRLVDVNDSDEIIKKFHKIKDQDFNMLNQKNIEDTPYIKKEDIKERYFEFLLKTLGQENIDLIKSKNFKIILDPVGGPGIIAKELLEKLNVNVIGINMGLGDFNRAIEPKELNLTYLKKIIKKEKADFAAAFDLDADRMVILLENQSISPNAVVAILADSLLSSSENIPEIKKSIVITDVSSNMIREIARKHNFKVQTVEVGEVNVIKKMEELNCLFGGEGSNAGAIIYPSKCRDGILSLLFILAEIARKNKSLQEIISDLPKQHNFGENIKLPIDNSELIRQKLIEFYKNYSYETTGNINGGIKFNINENSFVWFRKSATEPNLLRVYSDSDNEELAKEILKQAISFLKNMA